MNYLQIAETIYDYECGLYDYTPMIDKFGDTLVRVDEDSWQGDTYVLLSSGGKYGFLVFGWGSCSGCDALKMCDTPQEVAELMQKLHEGIRWFDSLSEAKDYICSEERNINFYFHESEWSEFVDKVRDYL